MAAVPNARNCLILGVTGQDGFHLASLLLNSGYTVFGSTRVKNNIPQRVFQLTKIGLYLLEADLNQPAAVADLFRRTRPKYVFNLAAQSSVSRSFYDPSETIFSSVEPTLITLELIRKTFGNVHYYHASSSEVFGPSDTPLTSTSPFNPKSPYGAAKASSSMLVKIFRESYDLFAVNGYMFNHESIYRHKSFVTRKILDYLYAIKFGVVKEPLQLGNIDIQRDWGLAEEYVVPVKKLLTRDTPKDCVICTGVTMSLRHFLKIAFHEIGKNYEDHVRSNDDLMRASDLLVNHGDSSEAEELIGWRAPTRGDNVVRRLVQMRCKSGSE